MTTLTSKNYFKALSIFYLALVIGPLLFGLIVLFLNLAMKLTMVDAGLSNIFRYVVPALALAGIVASHFVFKNKLIQIRENDSLGIKMENYRAALIPRYAMLTGPAFFATIAAFITGDVSFLAVTGIMLLILLYIRPGVAAAIKDLELEQTETAILEDPEGIIEGN